MAVAERSVSIFCAGLASGEIKRISSQKLYYYYTITNPTCLPYIFGRDIEMGNVWEEHDTAGMTYLE